MRTRDIGRRTYSPKKVKAVVGIESAIVLIAFVVVAAALAFVVLNMGFFTTQRSKETIGSGLAQASSSLELDGTVVARVSSGKVDCVIIPIRLSAGQKPVDLTPNKTNIAFWVLGKYGYANIYTSETQAVKTQSSFDVNSLCTAVKPASGINAEIIWQVGNNGDNVLDPGEKALVVLAFNGTEMLEAYNVFKVEIRVPIGAALTVERAIPASLTQTVIDLG